MWDANDDSPDIFLASSCALMLLDSRDGRGDSGGERGHGEEDRLMREGPRRTNVA